MIIRKDNFFTDSECDKIVEAVETQKNNYNDTSDRRKTLGNSFFNAISRSQFTLSAFDDYKKSINDFEGFWNDLLLKRMSEFLQLPARYSTHWTKPGFNIIEQPDNSPTYWHYDSDKVAFPYQDEFPDYQGNFSTYFDATYTFTIMLVDGDTTFDYYPQTDSQWGNREDAVSTEFSNTPCLDHIGLVGDTCRNPNCTLTEYKTEHYKKGTLLMQDTRLLHRKGRSVYANHDRISMQGYGAVKDGMLWLYW